MKVISVSEVVRECVPRLLMSVVEVVEKNEDVGSNRPTASF